MIYYLNRFVIGAESNLDPNAKNDRVIRHTHLPRVASVKPNTSGRPADLAPINPAGGRFLATDATLRMLLQFAYRTSGGRTLRRIDIIRAPAWAETDGFDIQAK